MCSHYDQDYECAKLYGCSVRLVFVLFVSDSQDYRLPSRVRASSVTVPGAELVASHVEGQKIVSDIQSVLSASAHQLVKAMAHLEPSDQPQVRFLLPSSPSNYLSNCFGFHLRVVYQTWQKAGCKLFGKINITLTVKEMVSCINNYKNELIKFVWVYLALTL